MHEQKRKNLTDLSHNGNVTRLLVRFHKYTVFCLLETNPLRTKKKLQIKVFINAEERKQAAEISVTKSRRDGLQKN